MNLAKKNQGNSRILLLHDLPQFSAWVAKSIRAGDCFCLSGAIGAGKTTFVHAVLKAMRMKRGALFSSPTFTVLNQYQTPKYVVNHIDLYRLKSYADLEDLDILGELEHKNRVSFIEWGDKFSALKNVYTKRVHFEYLSRHSSLERLVMFEGW